ncbi:hypothetical protein MBLNU457_4468t2 [Dothideomycetes sp. NU457]
MVSVSNLAFDRIGERPPTPPKDHSNDIDDALNFLKNDFTTEDTAKPDTQAQGVSTPPISSPTASQDDTQRRKEKKVQFCQFTVKHDGTSPRGKVGGKPALKSLPMPKALEPLKSILKSSPCTPTPDETGSPQAGYFSSREPQSVPKMLDSVLKMLASPTISLRLDGYQALNGARKTYSDLPAEEALRSKVPQLTQFIARDLRTTSNIPQSTNLITQALKLTISLLNTPGTASVLGTDFQVQLLDNATAVLGQTPVNKAIANHYMYLLASQNFNTRFFNSAKADLILTRLQTIHDRVTGNSVISARLVIYQRLIDQIPTLMLNKIRDWIQYIFHGVLSSHKDIRTRAIECGTLVAHAFGKHTTATKALTDLFASDLADGGDYGTWFTARLSDMLSDKDIAYSVPQVWGMIVLFFQNPKRPISSWYMFKPLLQIIQRCLNSSDGATKYETTLAWNRLVFVLALDLLPVQPKDRMVVLLGVPFSTALERRATDDASRDARRLAQSGYCNLLYYALQPAQSYERLDLFWDEYAGGILTKMMRVGGKDARFATKILKTLLKGGSTVWNPDRANEPRFMAPEELPRLDPRWVRSRLPRLLQVLEPYYGASLWMQGENQNVDASPWPELLDAVAEAGRQEVRASVELKEALAHLLNFYSRLWSSTSTWSQETTHDLWINRFGDLITSAITTIGALPLAEESMTYNQDNILEPAPTPSNRVSKHHASLQSPLALLWKLFANPPSTVSETKAYFDVASQVLQKVVHKQSSTKVRLGLLRQCLHLAPGSPENERLAVVARQLWIVISKELAEVISTSSDSIAESGHAGTVSRQIVDALDIGMKHIGISAEAMTAFQSLLSATAKRVQRDSGTAGVCIGLVEPVAEQVNQLRDSLPKISVAAVTASLLNIAVWPSNRQQMEDARKKLYGNHLDLSRKQPTFDPYNHMLTLIVATWDMVYNNIDSCRPIDDLFSGLRTFLASCPPSLSAMTMRKLQSGLAKIVEDSNHVFGAGSHEHRQVMELWTQILHSMRTMPLNSVLLKALADLMLAGFQSTHRPIVNSTIEFWNSSFGQLDELEYPESMVPVLSKLRAVAELELPSFPIAIENQESQIQLRFDEAEEDAIQQDDETTPKAFRQHTPLLSKPGHSLVSRSGSAEPSARLSATPTSVRRGVQKPTPKARLRHEDSQIDFVPVESSPATDQEGESQNLTEHQREVLQRQQFETAQMYPDFSSSPVKSTRESVSRLDFGRSNTTAARPSTPEPVQDQAHIDDFLGSSPTPRTAEKQRPVPAATSSTEVVLADEEVDEVEDDIPSSPPEVEDDDEHEHIEDVQHDVTDPAVLDHIVENDEVASVDTNRRTDQTSGVDADAPQTIVEEGAEDVQKPIDEAEQSDASVDAMNDVAQSSAIQDDEEHDRASRDSTPIQFSESLEEAPLPVGLPQGPIETTGKLDVEEDGEGLGDKDDTVEDSLTINSSDSTPQRQTPARAAKNNDNSQTGPGTRSGSRKRKSDAVSTPLSSSRKRKRSSPLKQLLPRWLGGSQDRDEAEEEYMEDCIVVASQPQPEPTAMLSQHESEPERSASQPTADVAEKSTKKRRGRPRKSFTPVTETPAVAATLPRGRKRKSLLADTSSVDIASQDDDDTTRIIETPAPQPRKTRRTRKSQDVKEAARDEDEDTMIPATSPRVVLPRVDINKDEYEQYSSDSENRNSPEKQLQAEAETAASQASQSERSILKPKSIMNTLRGVLEACRGWISLPLQEEREITDMLFDIRSEVVAASRRGEAPRGS